MGELEFSGTAIPRPNPSRSLPIGLSVEGASRSRCPKVIDGYSGRTSLARFAKGEAGGDSGRVEAKYMWYIFPRTPRGLVQQGSRLPLQLQPKYLASDCIGANG